VDTVHECDRRTDRRIELRSQRPCNAERRTVKVYDQYRIGNGIVLLLLLLLLLHDDDDEWVFYVCRRRTQSLLIPQTCTEIKT